MTKQMTDAQKTELNDLFSKAHVNSIHYMPLQRLLEHVLIAPTELDSDSFANLFGTPEQAREDFNMIKEIVANSQLPNTRLIELFSAISAAAKQWGAANVADNIAPLLAREEREQLAVTLLCSEHASSGLDHQGNPLGRLTTVARCLIDPASVTKEDIADFVEGFHANLVKEHGEEGAKKFIPNKELLQTVIDENNFPQSSMRLMRHAVSERAVELGVPFVVPHDVPAHFITGKSKHEGKGMQQSHTAAAHHSSEGITLAISQIFDDSSYAR